MFSDFDLEQLRKILKDFYAITHIRITVFDENRNELIAWPPKLPVFCRMIRASGEGINRCQLCDRAACESACRLRKTQIYLCHSGLTEAVTPLIVGEVLVGYLFFGHVFAYSDYKTGWQEIERRIRPLKLDENILKDEVARMPIISRDYVHAATHILLAVSTYMVKARMATLQEDKLAVKLDYYIVEHLGESLTAAKLCKEFKIGKTQLYQMSKELYHCGVAEHIRKLRMEKALELLRNPDIPLNTVADLCGYCEYNYFIAAFTRENGVSPGRWRKKQLKE